MGRRQRAKSAIGFGIVLDEDEVPDLDAPGIVGIDEHPCGIAQRREIDVELRTGAAGTSLPHHPEVFLHAKGPNMHLGIEVLPPEDVRPQFPRLPVELGGLARTRSVDGGVDSLLWQGPDPGEKLPCPFDGLLFEIVAE